MKLLTKGKSALDGAISVLAIVGGVIIVFVFVTVCLEVVMRYFLHNPLNWVVQVSEYSLAFITFLGAAWVLRMEKHVTMEIVINQLEPKSQGLLGMVTSIVGALVCLVLVIYGTQVAWDLFQRHVYHLGVLDVPKAPLIAVIPLSSLFLLFQFLRRTYGYLERWRASPKQGQRS